MFCRMLLVLQNIGMDMNNIMITQDKKSTILYWFLMFTTLQEQHMSVEQ